MKNRNQVNLALIVIHDKCPLRSGEMIRKLAHPLCTYIESEIAQKCFSWLRKDAYVEISICAFAFIDLILLKLLQERLAKEGKSYSP